MKLGISYVVFEGEELLEHVLRPIRNLIDFVSVVCVERSHIGERRGSDLREHLEKLKSEGLVDSILDQVFDESKWWRQNEVAIRQLGLEASRHAGCSHHIVADVDEFYEPEQLAYAKRESEGFNCTVVYLENYFKRSNWQIIPWQKHRVTLIFPVDNDLDIDVRFPCSIEPTRMVRKFDRIRYFSRKEFCVHHMSFVRKDISRKLRNSPNMSCRDIEQFIAQYNKYELGERIVLPPDFSIKRTRLQSNTFEIPEEQWELQRQQDRVLGTPGS